MTFCNAATAEEGAVCIDRCWMASFVIEFHSHHRFMSSQCPHSNFIFLFAQVEVASSGLFLLIISRLSALPLYALSVHRFSRPNPVTRLPVAAATLLLHRHLHLHHGYLRQVPKTCQDNIGHAPRQEEDRLVLRLPGFFVFKDGHLGSDRGREGERGRRNAVQRPAHGNILTSL